MRRSRKILIKSIIIIFLSLAVWFSLTYYLPLKQVHIWYNYELTITRWLCGSIRCLGYPRNCKNAMELGNPLILDNFNDSAKKMAEGFMVKYKFWKQSSKLINFVKNQRTIDNFL